MNSVRPVEGALVIGTTSIPISGVGYLNETSG